MRTCPIARPLLAILLAVVLLVLTSACGAPASDRPELLDAPFPTTAAATTDPADAADTPAATDEAPAATIATTDDALTVFAEPEVDAAVVTRLPATTEFGSPRARLVVDEAPRWVEVQLPIRPNGSTGWVRETAVDLVAGEHRVEVDLAARHLTVFEDDRVVLETPVAVGAPDAPTPTGTFAIVDLLQSPDPSGSYGPFALGLSAHSDTFSEFAGGDGQIGIHGTDDPSSIGQAVSHGCVRVPNDIVGVLAQLLPLGTPVTVF
jgi:lipoprotein-anchoring transpeptidase ErfK/SrfK